MERYLINLENWNGDEWQSLDADSHKDAALQAAEMYDSEEGTYPILGGAEKIVRVRSAHPDSQTKTFHLTGESVPTYYAEEE
jgi:hypothetical protein